MVLKIICDKRNVPVSKTEELFWEKTGKINYLRCVFFLNLMIDLAGFLYICVTCSNSRKGKDSWGEVMWGSSLLYEAASLSLQAAATEAYRGFLFLCPQIPIFPSSLFFPRLLLISHQRGIRGASPTPLQSILLPAECLSSHGILPVCPSKCPLLIQTPVILH